MLKDEARLIYAELFSGLECPDDLPERYAKAHKDLKLSQNSILLKHIVASEFAQRSKTEAKALTAKVRLVTYLAETTKGHSALMHTPKQKSPFFIFCMLGWAVLKGCAYKIITRFYAV